MTAISQKTHEQDVTAWRCERLIEAGFRSPLAARLAGDRRQDVHALIELVERGCPPHLAARILRPLDDAGLVR
jgi:plasmid stabilization system protein ParE